MDTKLKHTKFGEVDLYKFGNEVNLIGTIWRGREYSFLAFFPDNNEDDLNKLTVLDLDMEEWKHLIRQTDLLETEILQKGPQGITKAIVRKSQRQIDGRMQWVVFKRDSYTCRYCGADGVPLTVDHVDLWEEGGATIDENLLTACNKCNKLRGNMQYEDWLKSYEYVKRSRRLSQAIKDENDAILNRLDILRGKRVNNIRSR